MAINKVVFGNNTLIDLTNDTVSANTLLQGSTAHDRSGNQIQGAVVVAPIDDTTTASNKVWSSQKVNSELDDWTSTSTVQSDNTVTFSGLNDNYGYKLYCENKMIGISAMTKTGSGTSVTLVFTVTGASAGDVCKLRILK